MTFLKKAWAAAWRLLAFFTIWGVLSGPFIVPIASRRRDAPVTPTLQLYFDAVSLLTMIAVAWIATRFIDRRPFQSLGFRTAGLVRDMTAGLLIAAVMTAAALGITAVAGWARIDERASGIGVPFVILALSVAANSVAQELLFQGYVLQTIDRQFNTAIAVAGTAVLFTVAHAGVLTAGNVVPAGIGMVLLLHGRLADMRANPATMTIGTMR